jgi:outer membrane protein assembly factor BamA
VDLSSDLTSIGRSPSGKTPRHPSGSAAGRPARPSGPSARAAAGVAALCATLLFPLPAAALHYLEAEESIADLLREKPEEETAAPTDETEETAEPADEPAEPAENEGEPEAAAPEGEEAPAADAEGEGEGVAERRWAILPQLGFGPETGVLFGAKFTDRNFLQSGATFDVDAVFSLEDQQSYTIQVASPDSFSERFPILLRAVFDVDPRRRFFGLGNNDVGPDPASSHEIQRLGGDITVGWRVIPDLSLNLQIGGWDTAIRNGQRVDDSPPTPERFPDLPGIDGGVMIPFAASLVYDDRDDLVRPTQGWRVLAKVMEVSSSLGSDFDFTRLLGDASYLHPFFDKRLILGGRVGGQWLGGDFDEIPFFGLADLGGEDTARGYFPYRFLGTSEVYMGGEARVGLFGFDLFDWWRIQVDGATFAEVGRVFLDNDDLVFQGTDEGDFEQTGDWRFSYGAGLRLAFSEAMIVRIDAGFSDEETGLVYLTFGHAF